MVGGPKIERTTAKQSVQAAIPLITQSDAGSENFGTANCHTTARHRLDPSLADTLQHWWMRNKTNIKSESNWSILRRDFTPGFENLFDEGVNNGLYDASDALERYEYCLNLSSACTWRRYDFSISLVFRWLAIPWIQAELDEWVMLRNRTAPRADRNKILPHGIPELIRNKPEKYGTLDFKVSFFFQL